MKIIIDTREQTPYSFEAYGVETETRKLNTGDYSIGGLEDFVCVERKTLDDFVSSVTTSRKRFFKELERMKAFRCSCVIVEGSLPDITSKRYRSDANPASIVGNIQYIAAEMGIPVFLVNDRQHGGLFAFTFLRRYHKRHGGKNENHDES